MNHFQTVRLIIYVKKRDNLSLSMVSESCAEVQAMADLLAQMCQEFQEYRSGLIQNFDIFGKTLHANCRTHNDRKFPIIGLNTLHLDWL